MKVGGSTLAVIMLVAWPGCATIIGKSHQTVLIRTDPPGAEVTIRNSDGIAVWHGTAPSPVTLKAGDGFFQGQKYSVLAERNGDARSRVLDTHVNGWYLLGNLVFGGLIGWLIVDPATGAMWSLSDTVLIHFDDADAFAQQGSG